MTDGESNLERLDVPLVPSSEVPPNEIWIGDRRYKRIDEKEEQNRGDVSKDSPRPAQDG